jgi:putative transposase
MRKSRFSEEQIIGILRRIEVGEKAPDVCREQGISLGTYYRWKAQYGGLEVSQLQRLRSWRTRIGASSRSCRISPSMTAP